MRVRITKEDIRDGARGRPGLCALALALKRRGWGRPWIKNGLAVDGQNYDRVYELQLDAVDFIGRFDMGRESWPTTVTLTC